MPHKQKHWNPNRAFKLWHQYDGLTAIPKGWRPPRQEPEPEEVDREMSERMRRDEYFRENRSA